MLFKWSTSIKDEKISVIIAKLKEETVESRLGQKKNNNNKLTSNFSLFFQISDHFVTKPRTYKYFLLVWFNSIRRIRWLLLLLQTEMLFINTYVP